MRAWPGWVWFGLVAVAGAQESSGAAKVPALRGLPLVVGAPYEAVREFDREQVRPDGKKMRIHETTKFWRDGAGKTHSERSGDDIKGTIYTLIDPAAKVSYEWRSGGKVAFVRHFGEGVPPREPSKPLVEGEVRPITVTAVDGQRVKGTVSPLPAKTIDGLETRGSHVTQYGDADRKQVIGTTDSWYQPELHLALETDIHDARYGHRHFLFRNLKREEPRAELFVLPKGLTVKDAEEADTDQFE